MGDPSYSIIIPIYNEEKTLKRLMDVVLPIISSVSDRYELIFVNDGSTDQSKEILKKCAVENRKIKIIDFSRNFGHQIALAAGFQHAKGDAVIVMDADLQDPPELIPTFIDKWKEGYEIVYGVRTKREGESAFKRLTATLFYRILGYFSDIRIPVNVSDFRLIDKRVIFHLNSIPEQNPFWRGITSWTGFRQTGVEFVRKKRYAGQTHYPFKKMLRFAIDGITSFSVKPLRIATYSGFVIAFASFIMGFYALIERFVFNITIKGWASLMTAILFLGGIQLIMIGILGEYVGRIHGETKKRPRYIIRETINL